MTDRVRSLLVILDDDYRTDDAQAFVQAISLLKGVAKVELGAVVTGNDYVNRQIVQQEIIVGLIEQLRGKK